MSETETRQNPIALSEDQQAVEDYFSSPAYDRSSLPRQRLPAIPRRPVWPDRVLTPATSFGVGLAGLSGLLIMFGTVSPLLAGIIRRGLDAEINYLAFTILDQMAIYPAMVALTFAIITPVFWYGPVIARFLLAAAMITPGYLAFLYTASQTRGIPDDFWVTFTAALLAMFLSTAAVPVLVQMSSHWTLSHSRPVDTSYDPTSTRTLMELTGVTALTCTLLVSLDTSEWTETILLHAVLGALSGASVISMLIAFLRPTGRNMYAAAIATMFVFGTSFVYSGMQAFEAFGWGEIPKVIVPILIATTCGTVAYASIVWLFLWWLRSCGWACISREDEKRVREAEAKGPWKYWFGTDLE